MLASFLIYQTGPGNEANVVLLAVPKEKVGGGAMFQGLPHFFLSFTVAQWNTSEVCHGSDVNSYLGRQMGKVFLTKRTYFVTLLLSPEFSASGTFRTPALGQTPMK